MAREQVADKRVPVAGCGGSLPALYGLPAVQRDEMGKPRRERRRVREVMRVFVLQERDAQRCRGVEANAGGGANRVEERVGHLDRADPLALRLDIHGTARIEAQERRGELALEPFLRRLRLARKVAQQRAAMLRQRFEVEHLQALGRECVEKSALAGACEAAHDLEAQPRRQRVELRDHVPAPRAVAAVELDGAPTNLVQHVRQRAAALAAAPAVDHRRPAARHRRERTFEHRSDIARDERRTGALGGEARFLRVHRADPCALVVTEHRPVLGAGNVILGELGGRAHVDPIRIRRERVDGNRAAVWRAHRGVPRRSVAHRGFASSGASTGHTLSRSIACAATVGWIRSG